MSETEPTVIVVDDDSSFRSSARHALNSAGFAVQCFAEGAEFLSGGRPDGPACAVLAAQLPGMSGLWLQKELVRAGVELPLIFVTNDGDVRTSVEAMKGGAVDFLIKPVPMEELLPAIEAAIERDRAAWRHRAELAALRTHYDLLTPREREVMDRVVTGLLNKQIAAELGTVEKTIKFHRAHIMKKMEAASFAELVKMAGRLGG
jgi:FixJ family two-component response regulator